MGKPAQEVQAEAQQDAGARPSEGSASRAGTRRRRGDRRIVQPSQGRPGRGLLKVNGGDVVEEAFQAALTPDEIWANLSYDTDGVGTAYEVDRLLRVEDTLIAVEVKAGDLSALSLRERAGNLRDDDEMVGKASVQASRLLHAVRDDRGIRSYERGTGQDAR